MSQKSLPDTYKQAQNNAKEAKSVEVIITMNTNENECLVEMGFTVLAQAGDMLVASVPANKLEELSDNEAVKYISISEPVQLCTDKARAATHIDELHRATNLPREYTGKGVIVGVVDNGIDFQHIAFRDNAGISRIKAALTMKMDSTNQEHYHTYLLPDEIANLTTVASDATHGTHTANIAAGGFMNNVYYGVAPEADLVLCDLINPSTTAICRSIDFIAHFADSVNMPAVVNLSLGTLNGPHDGTGDVERFCSEITKEFPHCIICFSAGNEGGKNISTRITFTNDGDSVPQAQMLISNPNEAPINFGGGMSIWSSDSTDFGVQLFLYQTENDSTVWESEIYYSTDLSEIVYAEVADTLAPQIGIGIAAMAILSTINPVTHRYGVSISPFITGNRLLGLRLYGRKSQKVSLFAANIMYELYAPNNHFAAIDNYYISNSFACNHDVISVGSYNTRVGYANLLGDTVSYLFKGDVDRDQFPIGNISPFSSYGHDEAGNTYPFVAAPGCEIISAFSLPYIYYQEDDTTILYDRYSVMAVEQITSTNDTCYWSSLAGTSMSCPVVVGTIALWLQADPDLTLDEIKSLIRETADKDDFTAANSIAFGEGKINALSGIQKILAATSVSTPREDNNLIRKYIVNGEIIIEKNGNRYNLLGIKK
ncbi:MAG: S8 family serine peptidase [Paludibacteraceae bacterium]|nr:S8 family serine peptidase [Paludibacteraceae bacterium]